MTEATNKRDVPEHLVPVVLALIEKVNKRAAKLGLAGFTVTQGEAWHKRITTDRNGMEIAPQMITMVPITVTGEPVRIPGHEFIARIDFEDGATIVNTRPGVELPTKYRRATPFCTHCGTDRKRSSVFVFERDEGGHIQVGRSCLKDFMGHDPEATLWAAREYASIWGDIDDEIEAGMGRARISVAVADVLAAGARSIRDGGFVSKRLAEEKMLVSTSSDTYDLMFDPKTRQKRPVEQQDIDRAELVKQWVLNELGLKADKSDYEHNAIELVQLGACSTRRIGLLVSLIATHARITEERIAREADVDAHVGAVGERRAFDAVYRGSHQFDGHYGTTYIGRLQTDEGLLVYRGSSPFWESGTKAGDRIQFTGTIKEHGEYKGRKQTTIQRCKLAAKKEAA